MLEQNGNQVVPLGLGINVVNVLEIDNFVIIFKKVESLLTAATLGTCENSHLWN